MLPSNNCFKFATFLNKIGTLFEGSKNGPNSKHTQRECSVSDVCRFCRIHVGEQTVLEGISRWLLASSCCVCKFVKLFLSALSNSC